MGEIFIVNDQANPFTDKLIEVLKLKSWEYLELNDDKELDEHVTTRFQQHQIAALVIPVSLGEAPNNQMGFKLGLHIRLSTEIGESYRTPLLFVSPHSLETLLLARNDRHGLVSVTEGCLLCGQDVEDIRLNLPLLQALRKQDLLAQFLDRVIINRPENLGPHSLANEWGAYQLDRVAQLNSLSSTLISDRSKTLYFKYLRARNNFPGLVKNPAAKLLSTTATSAPNTINALAKKVLYIDDEGYKGWTEVLKTAFKGAAFTAETGKGVAENEFFMRIRARIIQDWDLILLDLRLLPLKEDIAGEVLPIQQYSGTKILQEIKRHNQGTQVIIFTASNKAWNMKQLLALKADGYYIKESPEYLIPDDLSLKHYEAFKNEVNECFERGYLRHIFTAHQRAIQQTVFANASFNALSEVGLNDAFELLRAGILHVAYLRYFQVIENYLKVTFIESDRSVIDLRGIKQLSKTGNIYHMTFHSDTVNGNYLEKADTNTRMEFKALGKLSFIMAFKFGKDDGYLKKLGTLVKVRNDIAHEGQSTLLTIQKFFDLIEIIHLFRANV